MTDLPILQPRDGENELWHARRLAFVFMGEGRSIEKVYQYVAKQSKTKHGKRPHPQWYTVAREHGWWASAKAWDEEVKRDLARDARAAAQQAKQEFLDFLPALRHQVLQGLGVYNRAMEPLLNPDIPFDSSKIKITDIGPLVAAMERVRAMERAEHGEPTARFDLTTNGKDLPPGVIVLSPDDLVVLEQIGWSSSELNTMFLEMVREMANASRPE